MADDMTLDGLANQVRRLEWAMTNHKHDERGVYRDGTNPDVVLPEGEAVAEGGKATEDFAQALVARLRELVFDNHIVREESGAWGDSCVPVPFLVVFKEWHNRLKAAFTKPDGERPAVLPEAEKAENKPTKEGEEVERLRARLRDQASEITKLERNYAAAMTGLSQRQRLLDTCVDIAEGKVSANDYATINEVDATVAVAKLRKERHQLVEKLQSIAVSATVGLVEAKVKHEEESTPRRKPD